MARNRHRMATIRWIIVGSTLTAGLFLFSWGLGNGQRVITVAGGSLVTLGLTSRYAARLRRNPRRWLTGTGRVKEVSERPADARFGRCTMQLVVDAPGMPADTVLVRHPRVPVSLWPVPGDELPIQVAADDVRVVKVLWKSYLPEPGAAGTARPEHAQPPGADDLTDPGPPDPSRDDPAAEYGDDPDARYESAPEHGSDDDIDIDLDGPPQAGAPARVPHPRAAPRRTGRRPSPYPRQPATVGAPAATAVGARVSGDAAGDPAAGAIPASGGTAGSPVGTAQAELATGTAETDPATTGLPGGYPSARPGRPGAIHGLGVTVLVTDLRRSATFYRDRLGFHELDGGDGSLVLASGETRLVLREVPDIGTVTRRLVHLNLEVTDIDAVYEELRAAGVRFLYPPRLVSQGTRLQLWAAAFRDPDGHGVAIAQWRPRAGRSA